jgi:hypothetical protein
MENKMLKVMLGVVVGLALLFSVPASFAVDGVVLINQSTVMAAGGFPYQINNPGSYKLSGNLTVTTRADAIDINSDDVTLDLNGFNISCASADCSLPPALFMNGVVSNGHIDITVKNGSVRGFGQGVGVWLTGTGLVTDVTASGNLFGIDVGSGAGGGFVVAHCAATHNNNIGIQASFSTVIDSLANHNTNVGFVGGGSTFLHNVAAHNGTGLSARNDLYGSNNFQLNSVAIVNSGSVSQNNNNCDGTTC